MKTVEIRAKTHTFHAKYATFVGFLVLIAAKFTTFRTKYLTFIPIAALLCEFFHELWSCAHLIFPSMCAIIIIEIRRTKIQ